MSGSWNTSPASPRSAVSRRQRVPLHVTQLTLTKTIKPLERELGVPLFDLTATGILVFVFSWNEFAVALNLTLSQTANVPFAIAKFAQDCEIQCTQMAASAAMSVLPALILLLIGQRYVVRGLTAGAVK